jgi:hypothetical protein
MSVGTSSLAGLSGDALSTALQGMVSAQNDSLLTQQTLFGMQQAKQEAEQTMVNEELKVDMNAADISAK